MDEIFALGNWHAIVDACTEFSPQDNHTCESISYFRDKIEKHTLFRIESGQLDFEM
jgi:hypothetical protein